MSVFKHKGAALKRAFTPMPDINLLVDISGEIKKGMIKIFPLICPATSN